MNLFLLDKNKLQPKASLDSNKQFETSPGRHDRLLNYQLASEYKNLLNSSSPMCTPTQEKKPQPSQKNLHKSKKNPASFVDPI
jgi:hypothetical protein